MDKGGRVADSIRKKYRLDILTYDELESLCFSMGAYSKYQNIDGAQGRILLNGSGESCVITINDKITYKPKRKFVLAHEFGHFNMHKQIPTFVCDENDLNDWNSKDRFEYEANDFAAELLMPSSVINQESRQKDISYELIKELANKFGSSITATSIQFCKYGPEPCCLIYSTSGIIEWFVKSEDFDLGYIDVGNNVPKNSIAGDYYSKGEIYDEKQVVDPEDWFNQEYEEEVLIYEDCFILEKYDSVISLIWRCEDYQ